MKDNKNGIALYQDAEAQAKVSVLFSEENVWLREATDKKFLLVRQEGERPVCKNINHYNLDILKETFLRAGDK